MLSFLNSPTLTSIHDYWKNHSFDYTFVIAFLPKNKRLLIFMAAVTICSDFGAQKNSLTLFPLFPHLFAMK